jgi:hypothetical protein
MFSLAIAARHPFSKTAAAALLTLAMAGCAQQRGADYVGTPVASTESDAQAQAQGRSGARAPSQLQFGFGQETRRDQQASTAETAESQAAGARPLAQAKTFLGTVPCLSGGNACSPTRITLTLAPDGQWRARTVLLDSPSPKNNIIQQGCWDVVGLKPWRILLQLQNGATKAALTFVNDNVLRINSLDDIQPALDYRLTRQADIDPIDELPAEQLKCPAA